MSKESTFKGILGDWERLNAMLNLNSSELAHVEVHRARFAEFLKRAQDAAQRQAVHTAGKQEASKELAEMIAEGERVATILRLSVKQHFGIRSEKLAEFGMQPFRGRKRKQQPTPEEPTLPPPANPLS